MHVLILGTRGVPSRHSGFETFAEDFSLFLKSRGHEVTVYCQTDAKEEQRTDLWNGIQRVIIPAPSGPFGTIIFDWSAVRHSSHQNGVVLTLGYNTGVFNFLYRLRRVPNVMNMDGIEWKREKWSRIPRLWFWFNEWAGARAANHLVADHPEIFKHLCRHTNPDKISMIPYGADAIYSAPVELVEKYGLQSKFYYLVVARSEPENSILEIVQAFSAKRRGLPLVVLGSYKPESNSYHKQVMDAAGSEVKFLGAIFDREIVHSLRFHAKAYIHGHRVGGTNPSMVESLAAGNAVIAHDNPFTRWVAGESARFFKGSADLAGILDLLEQEPALLGRMREGSRRRHKESFTQEKVLLEYEQLLLRYSHAGVIEREELVPASRAQVQSVHGEIARK